MTSIIKSQNIDMIHKTRDFEKELLNLEIAQKQARNKELMLKRQVKAAKFSLHSVDTKNTQDFLTVIATPSSVRRPGRDGGLDSFGSAAITMRNE